MKITLHHVNFCSTDVPALEEFYRSVLGLEAIPSMGEGRILDDKGYPGAVAFLTDGYVGNEDQILKTVSEQLGASRLFAFGIGSAVNRYLLEEMALIGRGAVQVVTPSDDPAAAAATFAARIDRAALTDVTIDWGGLRVADLSVMRN